MSTSSPRSNNKQQWLCLYKTSPSSWCRKLISFFPYKSQIKPPRHPSSICWTPQKTLGCREEKTREKKPSGTIYDSKVQIPNDLKIAPRAGLCVGSDVSVEKLFPHILAHSSNPSTERDFWGVWVVGRFSASPMASIFFYSLILCEHCTLREI